MKITVLVRAVLARHWIDNMLVSVTTRRGMVFISGRLHKITAVDEYDDVDEDELMIIEQEIRRIKGVKRISYNLEGWIKDGGRFVKVESVKEKKRERREGGAAVSYEPEDE